MHCVYIILNIAFIAHSIKIEPRSRYKPELFRASKSTGMIERDSMEQANRKKLYI